MPEQFSPSEPENAQKAEAYWYIACQSKELGNRPIPVRLFGRDLVLFRGQDGLPAALLDRCSHRNVPLSDGRCVEGVLQCPYHGWKFNGQGTAPVPAQPEFQPGQSHSVPSFAATESQGYVWVFGAPNQEPRGRPYRIPVHEDSDYVHVRYQADFDASIHATAENILDVPHTAFLHKGLLPRRKAQPNPDGGSALQRSGGVRVLQ